jgi:NADH:ubiquinone oxidoreductase subunit 3 (subunit A)
MKEVSLVIILNMCYTIFFDRFKIDELIEERGHKALQQPPYHCHFNPVELVWLQAERYYNSNIGQNGFGMEAV